MCGKTFELLRIKLPTPDTEQGNDTLLNIALEYDSHRRLIINCKAIQAPEFPSGERLRGGGEKKRN